jgi:hypothetical protein
MQGSTTGFWKCELPEFLLVFVRATIKFVKRKPLDLFFLSNKYCRNQIRYNKELADGTTKLDSALLREMIVC